MRLRALTRILFPILGMLCGASVAQTNTPISAAPRVQQAGRIDYISLGASFRVNNGNNGDVCRVRTGQNTTDGGGRSSWGEVTGSHATVLNTDRNVFQTVPSGSTIKAAYLYWFSSQNSDDINFADTQVTFIVNGTSFNVNANRVWTGANSGGGSMGAVADVTSLIPNVATANATMRMDGLSIQNNAAQCTNATVHGGWALYIVYENPGLSSKLISFYDGLEYIGYTTGIPSRAVTANGFTVPNASSLDRVSKVTVLVADGDFDAATGDRLSLTADAGAPSTLSSPSRQSDNYFGGVVSYQDEAGTETRQGGSANTATSTTGGVDIATVTSPTSVIPAGTRSITATITAGTSELLIAHSMVVMANTSNSNIRLLKSLQGAATAYDVGDTLRYILTLDNRQGTYEALDVVTTDNLPKGLSYSGAEISYDGGTTWTALAGVSASVNGAGGTTVTFPKVRRIDPDGKVWGGTNSVATLLGTQDVRYRLTVTANGDATGNLTNTATATNGSAETNTNDNTGSQAVTINKRADLAIDKSAAVAVGAGRQLSYSIRVWNNGPDSAGSVTLTDALPAGFTGVTVACTPTGSATCGTSSVSGNTVTMNTGTLSVDSVPGNSVPDGSYLSYTITGTTPNASGVLQNQATLTVPTGVTDPVPGNNTSARVDTSLINAVTDPAVSVAGPAGGAVSVLGNDTNGSNGATTTNSTVTISSNGGLSGLTVNGAGQLVIPVGAAAGAYTVTYQLCDKTVTGACDTAIIPITVTAATPNLSLAISGPAFARPSTVASTNPPVTAVDQFVSYTITVSTATANATGTTTVTTTLHGGLGWTGTYTSSTGAWTCTASTQTVTCTTTGTITTATPQTITLTNLRVAPGTAAAPTFTTSSRVSNPAETASDAATGNTASFTTRLILNTLTKSVRNVTADIRDNAGTPRFGTSSTGLPTEVLEYCIAVENPGGADLPNYVLTDVLNGLGVPLSTVTTDADYAGQAIKWTRTSASTTSGRYTAASGDDAGSLDTSLRVAIGTLLAGEIVTVCFQVQIR